MATGVLKFWNDPPFTIPRVDQVVPYPRDDTDTPLHTLDCCVSHPSLETGHDTHRKVFWEGIVEPPRCSLFACGRIAIGLLFVAETYQTVCLILLPLPSP